VGERDEFEPNYIAAIPADQMVPLMGGVIDKLAGFVARLGGEELAVDYYARFAADVNSLGTVRGNPDSNQVALRTQFRDQTQVTFELRVLNGNVNVPEGQELPADLATTTCTLMQQTPGRVRGDGPSVTYDALTQRGDALMRIRRLQTGYAEDTTMREVGRYPATGQTILDMADVAITGDDLLEPRQ
jgi:hypothetical protein